MNFQNRLARTLKNIKNTSSIKKKVVVDTTKEDAKKDERMASNNFKFRHLNQFKMPRKTLQDFHFGQFTPLKKPYGMKHGLS